jgi:hypothetical protein
MSAQAISIRHTIRSSFFPPPSLTKVASVIGGEFTVKMLLQLMPDFSDGEEVLKKILRDIENIGLIKHEQPPSAQALTTFTFVNSLIVEVIYGMMLFEQRRGNEERDRVANGAIFVPHSYFFPFSHFPTLAFHLGCAKYYEEQLRGLQEGYHLIAYHYRQAYEKDKDNGSLQTAREYFSKAGSASLMKYSNKEVGAIDSLLSFFSRSFISFLCSALPGCAIIL